MKTISPQRPPKIWILALNPLSPEINELERGFLIKVVSLRCSPKLGNLVWHNVLKENQYSLKEFYCLCWEPLKSLRKTHTSRRFPQKNQYSLKEFYSVGAKPGDPYFLCVLLTDFNSFEQTLWILLRNYLFSFGYQVFLIVFLKDFNGFEQQK